MDEAVFADGVPLRITPEDIKRWHLMSFPDLADAENALVIDEAIEAVYTMFSGSETLYDNNDAQAWFDKTRLLFRLLACWYIADQYPLLVAGTPVMGGLPLKAKKIGGVNLTFQDQFVRGQNKEYQDLLAGLKSNPWGNKAYMMIRAAVKRTRIGGPRRRV